MVKNSLLYLPAWLVLLVPAFVLGWFGWVILETPGTVAGVMLGLAIFAFVANRNNSRLE